MACSSMACSLDVEAGERYNPTYTIACDDDSHQRPFRSSTSKSDSSAAADEGRGMLDNIRVGDEDVYLDGSAAAQGQPKGGEGLARSPSRRRVVFADQVDCDAAAADGNAAADVDDAAADVDDAAADVDDAAADVNETAADDAGAAADDVGAASREVNEAKADDEAAACENIVFDEDVLGYTDSEASEEIEEFSDPDEDVAGAGSEGQDASGAPLPASSQQVPQSEAMHRAAGWQSPQLVATTPDGKVASATDRRSLLMAVAGRGTAGTIDPDEDRAGDEGRRHSAASIHNPAFEEASGSDSNDESQEEVVGTTNGEHASSDRRSMLMAMAGRDALDPDENGAADGTGRNSRASIHNPAFEDESASDSNDERDTEDAGTTDGAPVPTDRQSMLLAVAARGALDRNGDGATDNARLNSCASIHNPAFEEESASDSDGEPDGEDAEEDANGRRNRCASIHNPAFEDESASDSNGEMDGEDADKTVVGGASSASVLALDASETTKSAGAEASATFNELFDDNESNLDDEDLT
ncbi:hypothetical protein CYMTET_24222 [Cymbomonas tetramitiformis]|uniref:Uncharacterized protein n=1 Tax=Cymbomonas tetramitiformis TaxID=36881 RepID=A0AAE0L061_9CHLO|nr:hypothetical protein CYMTET_24222 [Cymbomonas tetramitiformis]